MTPSHVRNSVRRSVQCRRAGRHQPSAAVPAVAGVDDTLTPLLLVSTIALAAGLGAQGIDRPGTEAQAARATERLRALQREADALASQERTLLGELRQLELDREIQTEKLGKIDLDLDDAARGIGETTTRIEALEGQLAAARPLLKSRLVELYKLGSGGYARLLLGVHHLQQICRADRTAAGLPAPEP